MIDQMETDMMAVRWKIFHFNVRIAEKNQREIQNVQNALLHLF